jgi:hypothetical protein
MKYVKIEKSQIEEFFMKRYRNIVLILLNLFVGNMFGSPDYCTLTLNRVCAAKNALMSAENKQVECFLNPEAALSLEQQNMWQKNVKDCHDELIVIMNQLKARTKQDYPLSQLSSIGDIEDRQLMNNTGTFFELIANKLTSVNEGFQKAFRDLPQNNPDQFVKRRIKTLVAQAQQGILDAQRDLENFFGIVKDGKYSAGKHESVDLQRVWNYFAKNYPDGVPPVVSEWVYVLCNWYNAWFAGDKPIAVPVLKTGSNGDTGTSDASKLPSYPPLKAAAWIEERNTDKDMAMGRTADMLRNIADYRNGSGGPVRKSWESFKNKMKQTLEPTQQNGILKRFVKRLINAAVNQTARIARWIVVKTCFKRGTFDRKQWQETKAGQCLNELERGWTGRQEEEKPRSGWLKRLFTFNWRTSQ